MQHLHHLKFPALLLSTGLLVAAACSGGAGNTTASSNPTTETAPAGADTTQATATPVALRTGSAEAGRDVYRYETFGTEGYWTDAVRMPQGMAQSRMTVLDALKAGVGFDADAIPADLKALLANEVRTDLSPGKAPKLNDPATMTLLVKANAVIGMVPKGGKLLLDLARKPVFLHNDSVPSPDDLFIPKRRPPFYVVSPAGRTALVAYLKSLDTDSK